MSEFLRIVNEVKCGCYVIFEPVPEVLVDDHFVVGGVGRQDDLSVVHDARDLSLAGELVDSLPVFAELLANLFRNVLQVRLRPLVRFLEREK